jgi:hypothetical protein
VGVFDRHQFRLRGRLVKNQSALSKQELQALAFTLFYDVLYIKYLYHKRYKLLFQDQCLKKGRERAPSKRLLKT